MRKLRLGLRTGSLLALIALVMVPVSYELVRKGPAERAAGEPSFALPDGPQTYSIAQAAEVWPKIVEAKIDPPDVHVGDRQVIEAVVESRGEVDEVYADIETDNGTVRLALAFVGLATEELRDPFAGVIAPARSGVLQKALAQETSRGRYRGEWIVRDTHNTTYHTTITAKAGDDESSVTLAWSDVCGIPQGGDWNWESGCTISSPDGVDNGNATISGALTLNADFAFNSGFSFTLDGPGSIAVCGSCQILQTNVWQVDADADGFPASLTTYLQSSAPTNGRRRYLLQSTVDCDDATYSATNTCGAGGPIGHWSFDDGTGTGVTDSSGNSLDGTLDNGSGWNVGQVNGAYDFNGDVMTVTDGSGLLQLTGDLTINFIWYNTIRGGDCTKAPGCKAHAIKKDGYPSGEGEFTIEFESGSLGGSNYGGDGNGWAIVGESIVSAPAIFDWAWPTNTVDYGGWRMITITRSATEGKVYQDAVLNYEHTFSDPGFVATNNPLTVGPFDFGGSVYLDELQIYDRVLSENEINDLYELYF